MKDFLVLFREPDGRKEVPSPEFQASHQQHWKAWIVRMTESGKLAGGKSLTLNGSIIKNAGKEIQNGPHRVGEEIVGGYLLIRAIDIQDAVTAVASCPIFEADGYAEVREVM